MKPKNSNKTEKSSCFFFLNPGFFPTLIDFDPQKDDDAYPMLSYRGMLRPT